MKLSSLCLVGAIALLAAAGVASAAGRVIVHDDFESGAQGWMKWSTVEMTQTVRGPAHSGHAALWGEIRQKGPLVHSRPGLDFPIAGAHLSFWYFVPQTATFDHFEINLRTHDFGDRMFQMTRGMKKGAWTRFDCDFGDFFNWSYRALGSIRVKQFEIAATGVGSVGLDDVTITVDDAVAAKAPPVPAVIYVPGINAATAPAGQIVRFRKHLALAAVPKCAWLQAGGDDEASLWVNGHLLGKVGLSPATEFDLHGLLRAGDNVVAAEVVNHGAAPNPSGFVAAVGMGDRRADETVCVSDGSWRASADGPEGWTGVDFADQTWPAAQVVCRVPDPPFGAIDIYPLQQPIDRTIPRLRAEVRGGRIVAVLQPNSGCPAAIAYRASVSRLGEAANIAEKAGQVDLQPASTTLDLAAATRLHGAVEVTVAFGGADKKQTRVLWLGADPASRCDRTAVTRLPATGFFHTDQVGGRWFLIDAEGNICHTLSCNAVMERAYWSLAYHKTVAERYADLPTWNECALQRLLDLGFNSLCGGPMDPPRERNMPYFAGRCLTWAGPWLADADGNLARFPDVFDPAWQQGAEAWVREDTAKYRDDPLLIGYFTDNEIQMHQPLTHNLGIMGYFWSPSTAAEFSRWLKDRYHGDIETLNRKWSSKWHLYAYKDFADLPQDKPTIRGDGDPVEPDLREFVRHIVKTYVDTIVGLYHKYDPHHLVCTNRFAGEFDVSFADLLKPYDIIACNSYPRSRWGQTRFDDGQLAWLRDLHRITGRPVLITEWGVTAVDAGLPNFWGRLDTQAQRAEAYRNVLRQLWDERYVIGAHWFSWGDSTDDEASNWGLVDAQDRYYQPLAGAMREVNTEYNRRIQTWRP